MLLAKLPIILLSIRAIDVVGPINTFLKTIVSSGYQCFMLKVGPTEGL